jgi:hypothetical protein
MTTSKLMACILAATLVAALVGCSGAGAPVQKVRGDALTNSASAHLSALVLVRSWFHILYLQSTTPASVGPRACEPHVEVEFSADGTMHMWGNMSDCSTFDYVQAPDGSGSGWRKMADGKRTDMTWTAPSDDGVHLTYNTTETFWDGTVLDFVFDMGYGLPTLVVVYEGTARLKDGRQMAFKFTDTQPISQVVDLGLPDGSSLHLSVPMRLLPEGGMAPDYAAGATGTFTAADRTVQTFKITGAEASWDRWQFSGAEGLTGDFALSSNMAGSGQLLRNGKLAAALRWPESAAGVLDIVAASSIEVNPSAAARDFQIDRWISTIAALGPSPY